MNSRQTSLLHKIAQMGRFWAPSVCLSGRKQFVDPHGERNYTRNRERLLGLSVILCNTFEVHSTRNRTSLKGKQIVRAFIAALARLLKGAFSMAGMARIVVLEAIPGSLLGIRMNRACTVNV